MNINKEVSNKKINKLPSVLLSFFTLIIIIVAMIISANKIMEYMAIKQQTDSLQNTYNNKLIEVNELKYYLSSEVDDEYKERMARIMGYCFPDEIIYYVE